MKIAEFISQHVPGINTAEFTSAQLEKPLHTQTLVGLLFDIEQLKETNPSQQYLVENMTKRLRAINDGSISDSSGNLKRFSTFDKNRKKSS